VNLCPFVGVDIYIYIYIYIAHNQPVSRFPAHIVDGISDVSEPLARAKVPTPVVSSADQRGAHLCSTCKQYNCSGRATFYP